MKLNVDNVRRASEMLGKQVVVSLDDAVVVKGVLIAYSDYGEATIQDEDGSLTHCWPMLDITEVQS